MQTFAHLNKKKSGIGHLIFCFSLQPVKIKSNLDVTEGKGLESNILDASFFITLLLVCILEFCLVIYGVRLQQWPLFSKGEWQGVCGRISACVLMSPDLDFPSCVLFFVVLGALSNIAVFILDTDVEWLTLSSDRKWSLLTFSLNRIAILYMDLFFNY